MATRLAIQQNTDRHPIPSVSITKLSRFGRSDPWPRWLPYTVQRRYDLPAHIYGDGDLKGFFPEFPLFQYSSGRREVLVILLSFTHICL